MNKNQILENLNEIAAALDDQNMTREADDVTKVMTRVAQAPSFFAPQDLRKPVPQAPQPVQNPLQQLMQQTLNQAAKTPQQMSQEDALVKRYLGWAFHAISVKGVSVANARAALIHHLQANKQSPAFVQKVMQAFETQIANQQALRGK